MADSPQEQPSRITPLADAPMPLDEARRVIWQTQPKQPMGQLLERGKLTRKDLEWAINKAFRPDVKRAAQRLLQELDQPTTTAASSSPAPAIDLRRTGPNIVIGSRYLEDQESLHGWMLIYGIGIGIASLVTIVTALVWLLRGQALWLPALSLLANAVLWIGLLWLIRHRRRARRAYQAGRKGEDQVAEQLRQALDQRWTIYRNLQLPDRKDDLDLVLVGPGGVWTFQIKATGAPLRVQGGRWEVRRGRRWVAAQPDPARQVTRQATALNDFFKRQGINRFVDRAIALAEPQPFDQFTASEIPVWLPFEIEQRAAALSTRHPPSADEQAQINELLRRRADAQRAAEQGLARQRRSRSHP
jgi:Nuclease-related domain